VALRYGVADERGIVSTAPTTLSQLYFAQASVDRGGSSMPNCTPPLRDPRLVVKSCPANEPCEPPAANELQSSSFECGMSTDLATSMVGMHPDRVWVTRFDLKLPSTALDADCVVSKAVADVEVQPFLNPKRLKNAPCAPALFSAGTGSLLLGLWASSALLSRRRKRALNRC
jgi:hypothetical protein